ncbi:DoxX family protein [Nocardioides halotolerans]|uniref:DoxX family protein n=1 Tax=Nocardioides halotolerans TaxID=433660 RepID=UPI00040BF38F|nr:DoxX family protein [Nocardioides halotolerans]
MPLPRSSRLLVGGFLASGAVHLARPEVYEPLMPAWLPAHREVILASGVAELACAVGMALPRTRRVSGWASVALLLGVWPGNLKMALDSNRSRSTAFKALAWGRMPLQVPMIGAAVAAARSAR